ncbi:MAG TPA: chloride channel protein [Actinomycetota bacterium]|nr:chloride channel protein [Actinomycetota bacterium]
MLKTPFRWAAGRAGTTEEAARFWLLVLVVGLMSGLAGGLYVEALRALTRVLGPQHWARATHLVLFGVVGGAIGVLTLLLGNPGDVELLVDNIHIQGGAADLRKLPSLIPISLLGIATGSAIGPEAPLVQTTGSLGSWIARRGKVSVIEARSLTITGMAAGFTVLFGTPLGSAIFALEILHRRGLQYYEALVPAALGSLSGYAVYVLTTHLGLTPIWHFPEVRALHASALGIAVLAGVAGAAIAYAFSYLTTWLRHGFRLLPVALRPVAGGLALGGLAWMSPYALTFGEGQIQTLVNGRLLVSTLLVATLAKLLGSSTIVSSGWRGGFIIPLFFMGAALGKAGASVLHVDATVAMLSLMVAANVGVTKTPFGSALIVVEMAGVRMFPPVLAASLIAFFLTSQVSLIHTQRAREGAFAPEIHSRDPNPGGGADRYAGPPA